MSSAEKEADRLRAQRDALAAQLNAAKRDITRLEAEVAAEKRTAQTVRDSLSFRMGQALMRPASRVGRAIVPLLYRILKMSPVGVRRVVLKVAGKSKTLTSLRQFAATGTAQPNQKTGELPAGKASVLRTVKERINEIKRESGGTSLAAEPRRKGLKIGIIMDNFSYDCFKHEASLIIFTPENWRRLLAENKPDLLLVESAWQGNGKSWRYKIANWGQKLPDQLPELVQWCKTQSIPAAFWNKEDPTHYKPFLEAAKLFDYVFTTDADCVERYKKDLGHNRVFCLPFAAQPRIHNPAGSGRKIRDVGFAGSWYALGHEDRARQMEYVLKPALAYDVDIYDRYLSLKDDNYRFPEQYLPYVVGELPYNEMVYAYKMYKVFLNVNIVQQSPTMFARRIPEILASGTCVLSGYSKGIENLIGSDIVKITSSPEETKAQLDLLLGDKELRDRLAHLGLRKVMKEHTYEKRLDYILQMVGIGQGSDGAQRKGVSVVTCTNKGVYKENIFSNYDRQRYEDRELIIVIGNDQLDLQDWEEEAKKRPNVRVYRVDEKLPLGACLNFGVDEARFEYIAKFDDDDYYAPAYLEDMMMAFDYSRADIVGKCTRYVYFESGGVLAIRFPDKEHQFTDFVSGSAMIIKRGVFSKVRFDPLKRVGEDTQFLEDCVKNGVRIYSADRFNFAYTRRSSAGLHTWRVSDEELLAKASEIVPYAGDYTTHVTL